MGVVSDIMRTYRAPRSVVRHRIGVSENEGAALITLVIACGLIFVAQWPRMARQSFDTGEDVQMLIGAAMLAWMFIAPLIFYTIAALLGFALRLVSKHVTGYATRVATFWALLAASPLWLFWGLTAGLVGPSPALQVTGAIAFGALVVFWGLGLSEVVSPTQQKDDAHV